MTLHSFGCSFIYGSDLDSPSLTWPSLMARELGCHHICHAVPGAGNLQIMESVLQNYQPGDICIVGWTWIDRFDFVDISDESWQTLRPALDHQHADFYYRNLHSQYRDMLTNLCYIKTVIDTLGDSNYIMTALDYLLFEEVNPNWHQPNAVSKLQNLVKPHIKDFGGKNFLDWSRDRGFDISEKWHPLEDAHKAAADYFIDAIRHKV